MPHTVTLDQLWESAATSAERFDPATLALLPEPARRYLTHSVAPGTPLAGAVRLQMKGEIKLREWLPFTAEEVIDLNRGMIWKARVSMKGLPITGSDRLIDGRGSMRWKLLGLFPVMKASGPEITRSTAGRVAAESLWIPSALCSAAVSWSEPEEGRVRAEFAAFGCDHRLTFALDESGRPRSFIMPRWGDPDGTGFRYCDFGGIIEGEQTFGGYTIPSRLRLGWHYGTERFQPEGEFFRVTLERAEFR